MGSVPDPNYGFHIPAEELSDHFMDTVLTDEEVQINRKSKVDHSWYGRMPFPDPVDRPARTVMATQTGVSRETLVLEWEREGSKVYRRPTIREAASFQTFPITYQFWGRTAETRYKLVGNAVPPVLAGAVARAIARKMGRPSPAAPIVTTHTTLRPPPVKVSRRRDGTALQRYPADRKFRDHLPGSRSRGFRVDLDNLGGDEAFGKRAGGPHPIVWTARLYAGSGKHLARVTLTLDQALEQFNSCLLTEDQVKRARRFRTELEEKVGPALPDSRSLQEVWAGGGPQGRNGPVQVLSRLARAVDE
ncbi:C-5 cytosine-specific DNA methylase, partial [mine drainage metagenome]